MDMSKQELDELFDHVGLLGCTSLFMDLAGQLAGGAAFDGMFHGMIVIRPDGPPPNSMKLETIRRLRKKMLREEVNEYLDAEDENNLVEMVDGLLDIIVIAWGSVLAYVGADRANKAAKEVAISNLAKVIGEGLPKFRSDGKVLKPEGWEPPNISEALWGNLYG